MENSTYPLRSINNAPSSNRNDASPLDFSFRRLKAIEDLIKKGNEGEEEEDILLIQQKQQTTLQQQPSDKKKYNEDIITDDASSSEYTNMSPSTESTTTENAQGDFPKPIKRPKSRSKCLRLNNNSLKTVDGLPTILTSLFLQPLYMSWLDLSFNRLTEISAIFCDLPYLQILYLHGNCIKALSQVENLRPATHLKKLTLHGNPIESVKNYRNTVLTIIPSLNEFDFSCILRSDRDNAEVWKRNHQNFLDRKKNARRRKALLEKMGS